MLGIGKCLDHLMALHGVLGASIIDYASGSTLGAAGRGPASHQESYSAGVTTMMHTTMKAAALATVGNPAHVEQIVITAGNGFHLLHPLAGGTQTRMMLYVWLDRGIGNLAVTQRRVNSIAAQFSVN
ncbi:hypothetical protein Rhe02_72190 [Rhizocola hellebori]|uniref:Uncharacterized protein n=2 Tax=Rhizocola hellebori TaxID=1392758 RepID=A0A8J3QFN0_9ACTN|nr:hypothetical protein Rhe02_72190 [Rhizocola hellebori]